MNYVKMDMTGDRLKREVKSKKWELWVIYIQRIGALCIEEIMQKYHIRKGK